MARSTAPKVLKMNIEFKKNITRMLHEVQKLSKKMFCMLRSVNIIFNLRNREVKIILYPKKKKKKNTSRHEVRDRLKYQVPIEFKLELRADVKCVMLISVCLPFSRRKQKKNI